MSLERLPKTVSLEQHFNREYVATASRPSYLKWVSHPEHPRNGRDIMTRPSEEVRIRYNPEFCLVPDPVSDAFGRMAAFSLGDYYSRGGLRDLPTREYLASLVGGIPDDHRYYEAPATRAPERILDLGTGSGIFSVSLLDAIPVNQQNIHIDLVDTNATALATADTNIKDAITKLHSIPTVNTKLASWLEGAEGKYKVIYFNPPYLDESHEILSSEAAMAPYNAIRVAYPWQEYGKVLPELPQYLDDEGVAIIRLPKEPDTAMFGKLSELCKNMAEPYYWMFVELTAGEEKRKGFGLLLVNGGLPSPFGDYDYYVNYLDGKYKPYAKPSDTMNIYHDAFCEIKRYKQPFMEAKLGLMNEVEIQK